MSTIAAHSFLTRLSTRTIGVMLAFVTACASGVAVYVNSKGVSHFDDATVYTTAKNAVAGALLLVLALPLLSAKRAPAGKTARPRTRRDWLALGTVACIGGSVPFVLFFEGLSHATATQAAFIHKTLVVWVAVLAVPILRERLGPAHVAAISLVMLGQGWLAGELGTLTFGTGEAMILGATLLWAVEVIVVKKLVTSIEPRTLAFGRMGLGTALLVAWLAVSGRGGDLFALSSDQWAWALATGLLLSAYVATWYMALARAQAVDVTAVLVFGAVVTAVLAGAADGVAIDTVGLALITAGVALAAAAAVWRATPREARA